MEELKKYKKKLELRGSKLVNENPRTDSVVYIFLKSFKIDYNPNRLKDKQFKKVYTSIKVPVKLVKTVGIEEKIPTLKDVHVGVLLIFMFATLISILIGSILNLFL